MSNKLTDKQQVFIDEYLKTWNATEAARRAGYARNSIRSIASENLTKPNIKAEIARRLKELEMESDEVLRGLADIARGSMADFTTVTMDGVVPNLMKAKQRGKLHLVKKLTFKDGALASIELYDKQAALVQLGRHHQLFVDRVQVDWRKEVEDAGISPGDVFEELVQHIQHKMSGPDDNALSKGGG